MTKLTTYIRFAYVIAVFWISILNPEYCYSQNINRPDWINNQPKSSSGLYQYHRGESSGNNEVRVFRSAIITAFERAATLNEGEVNTALKELITKSGIEGLRNTEIIAVPFWFKNASIVEHFTDVEIVSNRKEYKTFVLLRIPVDENSPLNPTNPKYGFEPIWRSTIVPGWGQFHKGEQKKGWRFLISETVFVSSFFISNYFSQNYSRKAENDQNYDNRKFYNDWANRSYTIGTVSGIIAGAIYAYNIFDSVTSKGVKQYALNENKPVQIFAGLTNNQPRITFSINF